ncbi:MAG: DNA methyltransferase, partial [Dehalococcoidales bacterium]|nr:DNA methyltransferase [Dehalococcoidales bacterium]
MLDEVFGSENFISLTMLKKSGTTPSNQIANVCDYLLWYAKSRERIKFRRLFWDKNVDVYTRSDEGGDSFSFGDLQSAGETKTSKKFVFEDKEYHPRPGYHWSTSVEGLQRLAIVGRIELVGNNLRYRRYAKDFPMTEITNIWGDVAGIAGNIYVVQTPTRIIERCLLMTTDPSDLVLDPTCGSGTTAFVAEEWGRRWITIDTSRVALALARTRLMSAKYPYYLLSDSPEGVKKEAELTGRLPPAYKTEGDIRKGFVYNRVPHVTLKSIANNPDIKEGMTRKEIDEAIARHTETETLYDQPYEDNKRVRVTGPFTVESLSPHRFIALEEERPATEKIAQQGSDSIPFETMILDNLKKAGVQNTIKNEKIKFDRLEPYAGEYLQATGEYTDKDGKIRRVAVSIGPQYGTVGPDTVKEAAKEAVQGIGYDVLIVCGFAFDPHVSEEAKRYGKLIVLIAHISP